jgi:hypothetical protein
MEYDWFWVILAVGSVHHCCDRPPLSWRSRLIGAGANPAGTSVNVRFRAKLNKRTQVSASRA